MLSTYEKIKRLSIMILSFNFDEEDPHGTLEKIKAELQTVIQIIHNLLLWIRILATNLVNYNLC